jgi:hypothetical protein
MDRRRVIARFCSIFALGSILLLGGCQKGEKPSGVGNEEKLWQLAQRQGKIEEPIELAYVKKTPALYRDASMGKADPSFVPRVVGG